MVLWRRRERGEKEEKAEKGGEGKKIFVHHIIVLRLLARMIPRK
jgi:hypothetical protein